MPPVLHIPPGTAHTADRRWGRRHRLRDPAVFDTAFALKASAGGAVLVVYAVANSAVTNSPAPPRMAIRVGRKYGHAVDRNRLKRLVRTAFAGLKAMLPAGVDFVVVPRPVKPPAGSAKPKPGRVPRQRPPTLTLAEVIADLTAIIPRVVRRLPRNHPAGTPAKAPPHNSSKPRRPAESTHSGSRDQGSTKSGKSTLSRPSPSSPGA